MAEVSEQVAAYFKRHENPALLHLYYRPRFKVADRVAEIRAFFLYPK